MLRHIAQLNLRSTDDYKTWCEKHGFKPSLAKTYIQQQREIKRHQDTVASERLYQHSQESRLRAQIVRISHGNASTLTLNSELLLAIADGFRKSRNTKILLDTLLYLECKSKLLSDSQYVHGVVALVSHHSSWIRPLNQWQPLKHSARRQFACLSRYLLATYDVPAFMDSAWFANKKAHQRWFIHIGQGGNIRTAETLPVPLTKRMAHLYLQAPAHYNVLTAFRWAQVQVLGGGASLSDAIVETQLARRFKDDAFWMSVIRFFIENPELDRVHIHPIVDYIWHERYVDQQEFDEAEKSANTGPAQPRFTMRGRTVDSLLAQVERWHRRLGRGSQGVTKSRWSRWVIDDYRLSEGGDGGKRIWHIRELLSSNELFAEGRTLKHCVASYAAVCSSGISAIYTMDVCDVEGVRKLLTIEVHRRDRVLTQVRGKRNRLPTKAEALVVQRWAQENGLRFETWR